MPRRSLEELAMTEPLGRLPFGPHHRLTNGHSVATSSTPAPKPPQPGPAMMAVTSEVLELFARLKQLRRRSPEWKATRHELALAAGLPPWAWVCGFEPGDPNEPGLDVWYRAGRERWQQLEAALKVH